ncbi:MAG TPA: acetyl-CoA carboxylase biotin carboxylase subunit [Clostridiaceae bacterium]|nr:acetyl-CoA carboxylase biotin carboxylase subunit [Clostridiaceae bacterium]
MFRKILIANRGEIAITIIRACREMGIRSVAVFSEADRQALHAQLADESICIGPAPPQSSYLNPQALLAACSITGAEAIHPGFGFLSENAAFATMCAKMHITFIGPSPETMRLMGDKATARETASNAGVPITPGSTGIVTDLAMAQAEAERIGYPVMVKAASGGGGRGMRIAREPEELKNAFMAARVEAKAAFGDDRVYIERFLQNPRHVEIQLMADQYGNVVHYGDRDCSIQRRNQKMIEEATSPFVDRHLRRQMGEVAIRLAAAVGYTGAGTVEFLVDAEKSFYFMEMNTRIQVEHPVTEAITGTNLIKEQIRVAAGYRLSQQQNEISFIGHAMECRINAEDPLNNFLPTPGVIKNLVVPGGLGVRIDSALYPGYEIPSYYDSMLAKVIVHAPTRREAIARMRRVLTEFLIEGVKTNIDFHLLILRDPEFIAGDYDIGYLGRKLPQMIHDLQERQG